MSYKHKYNVKENIQDFKKVEKNIKAKKFNFLLTIYTNQQFKENDPNFKKILKYLIIV